MTTNRVHIFDFDGTIARTNKLKTDAFAAVAQRYGSDAVDWFVEYHTSRGGITRQVKIAKLYERYSSRCPEVTEEQMLDEFAALVEEQWLDTDFVPGAQKYLRSLNETCVILSGGNEEEIKQYLAHHGLLGQFGGVYGNPTPKDVNLARIKETFLSESPEVWFYGDSRLDFELCKQLGGKFIYVKDVSEWSPINEAEHFFKSVQDFRVLVKNR